MRLRFPKNYAYFKHISEPHYYILPSEYDQNNSYEITINGFQVRKINEIRNLIFGLRYGKPSSALRPKFHKCENLNVKSV